MDVSPGYSGYVKSGWPSPRQGQSSVIWRVIKVGRYPVEQQEHVTRRLLALRCVGFQFAAVRDAGGVVVALTGVRAHHGVIDIVQLYGEHDADAIRIPGDEPDILRARTTIWRSTGTASDVIDKILVLADPDFGERKSSPRVNESASGQSVQFSG